MTNRRFSDIIMANSWSFLYDELNMTNSADTINLGDTVIYGGEGTDTISFQAAQPVPMNYFGAGEDTITFSTDTISFDIKSDNFSIDLTMPSKRFKYSEERILKELTDYISATYNQHYSAGDDKVCLLYTSPSPRDVEESRMPSSA